VQYLIGPKKGADDGDMIVVFNGNWRQSEEKQQRAAVEETDPPIREIGHIELGPGEAGLLPFCCYNDDFAFLSCIASKDRLKTLEQDTSPRSGSWRGSVQHYIRADSPAVTLTFRTMDLARRVMLVLLCWWTDDDTLEF
jgi:hypothetical protein